MIILGNFLGIITGVISAIATAAVSVTQTLAVVGLAVEGLKTIGNILTNLGKALGLIKPETKVEDLGDKAIQSGYNPEDYDSYAEYVKAVEEYELDPEKSKLTSEEDKIKKGMELTAGMMIEKYNDLPIADLCVAIGENPEYFTNKTDAIAELIETDGSYISNILNYINGTEKNEEKIQETMDILMDIDKNVNPALTDNEAFMNALQIRK